MIKNVRALLRAAESVAVVAGAGLSAQSGVPTFRGAGGLWESYRAEELATPEAFLADPELVWRFYSWRRSLMSGSMPNPGHAALVELESRLGDGFLQITQNIDGLHRVAGSKRYEEVHGCIWELRCEKCGYHREDRSELSGIPLCPSCGRYLRPDVVWFGEQLPSGPLERSIQALTQADMVLIVGTSGNVQPVASFAKIAADAGAVVVEINPNETPISGDCELELRGSSAEILPEIL